MLDICEKRAVSSKGFIGLEIGIFLLIDKSILDDKNADKQ
jgi:hypothetical protein